MSFAAFWYNEWFAPGRVTAMILRHLYLQTVRGKGYVLRPD